MSPQPGYLFLKNRRDTRLPAAPSLTYHYTRFQIIVNPPSRHCEERSDVAIRTLRPPESRPKNGIPQSASLTAPFHKGAYWCSTSAPLVKGGTPPKAEGGFRPPLSLRGAQRRGNPSPRPIFFKFSPNFFIFRIDKFPLFIYNKHQETRRRYSAPPLV